MSPLENSDRLQWVGYGPSPQCVERRLHDAHQRFTRWRLFCINQRPLGRIASMPATGHERSSSWLAWASATDGLQPFRFARWMPQTGHERVFINGRFKVAW